MRLGPTHYEWRHDVDLVVQKVLSRFSNVTANTYTDHPWEGWDHLSVDFWGASGRGDALPEHLRWPLVRFLFRQPGKPLIRHCITEHSLWTRQGGWTWWTPNDHSGRLAHVHVTYLP